MKKFLRYSLVLASVLSHSYADDDVGAKDTIREKITRVGQAEVKPADSVNTINELFENGKVSGQIEVMYSGYKESGINATNADPYSTAIGGQLMYKSAHLNGFAVGAEFTTVHEIAELSGEDDEAERSTMMVSGEGDYTELSQAYLEYVNAGLTLRVGRQLIDAPLADRGNIRIVNNTFQGYTLRYDMEALLYENDSFAIIAGYLDKWQGTDTGLVDSSYSPASTDSWQNTGDNGTAFIGVSYESDIFHFCAWYYDISKTDPNTNSFGQNIANRSIYADVTYHAINKEAFSIDISAQYLQQNEDDNSGIEADIYGVMLEANVDDFSFLLAYNKRDSDDTQTSFSGFGGGTLYTNLDNMIIDTIGGGDVDAYVAAITYSIGDATIGYVHGSFLRDATSTLAKEEIIEHNIGVEYSVNDNLTLFGIITLNDDKEDTGTGTIYNSGDFTNIRVAASYNF